jgi:general secretion pathway protein G
VPDGQLRASIFTQRVIGKGTARDRCAMRRPEFLRRPFEGGSRQEGFTVVELLIVVAIILTISAMAIPSLQAAINDAKVARAVGDIHTMETEILEYDIEFGKLPNSLADIGRGNFLDPWGTPYQYLNHSTKQGNGQSRKDRFLVPLNSDYDLYSEGQDQASSPPITAKKSQDDIIRASDGSFIGLASQF